MNAMEKLRVLLPHWIEHNASHRSEFTSWAGQMDNADKEISALLHKAAASLLEAEHSLREALHRSGGEMPGHGPHHHHHHHNLPE